MKRSYIFDPCIDYFPEEKHFIYDYGVNFQTLVGDLSLLNIALTVSFSSTSYCMDVIRDYTCNYIYPGCNNETGLPQGICTEECQRYVLSDMCQGEFYTLERGINDAGRLTFTRQCNDTLLLLRDFGISSEVDPCDCTNITGS